LSAADDYVRDLLGLLLARAKEAKSRCEAARAKGQAGVSDFECGRALAYYEVLSTLINQLETFGITRRQAGLDDDLDVDKELL
jgi:hypothetical protein